MASFATAVKFTAVSTGTVDFVVSAAVTGYQTPAASGQVVDTQIYKYRAANTSATEWEEGYGASSVSSTTFARTTVLSNSLGTQAKISFTAAPQVSIVAHADDLIPVDGAMFGLTLSTAGASATFSVATGWCADSTAVNIMRIYTAISKTTSAWAVGSTNGGLDTGAVANSTWYHVFVITRLDTGVTDVLFSLSATAPTMPTNYTLKRRIGSMKTNGSAQWTSFIQLGDEFVWLVPPTDINTGALGTTATLFTLSVPTGLQVWATVRGAILNAAITSALLTSPDETSAAASVTTGFVNVVNPTAGASYIAVANTTLRTNTSAQIRAVSNNASTTLQLATTGWTDIRGRLF